MTFSESVVEDATLGWLESLGYAVLHGPDNTPVDLKQIVLLERLYDRWIF
jgi:hypothetical protein